MERTKVKTLTLHKEIGPLKFDEGIKDLRILNQYGRPVHFVQYGDFVRVKSRIPKNGLILTFYYNKVATDGQMPKM